MEVTKGPARQLIPAREWIDKNDIRALTDAGVIITDERRSYSAYFDGRFLTAHDLTRDQNYFLTRQADLGQAGGAGVVHGLMVSMIQGSAVSIEAGHGVTTSGELVVISNSISHLDLINVPEMQRLNSAFGLSQIPIEPLRTRSGLFILALRAVEFTANPIASYPTSIDGSRTVEDGDVIEAVAITLIPYPEEGSRTEVSMRRARMARKIFVEGGSKGVPAGLLPLAVIALDRGVVRWVDSFMVRREVGAEHGNIVGLGFAPRALREAHLLQYEFHLREVVRERAVRGLRFAATEHFLALPAAGQMPAASIDPSDFTQVFFPASVQVDLSIIPEDELPGLIEESLLLPAIDLTLDDEHLTSTSVLALIPVSRQNFQSFQARLSSLQRRLAVAAPDMVSKRLPIEALRLLKMPFATEAIARDLGDDAWRNALSQVSMLWFVRRRNLSYKADLAGNAARVSNADERRIESNLIRSLTNRGQAEAFKNLQATATAPAGAAMVSFLSSPKFERSEILMPAALSALKKESRQGGLDQAAVDRVAANFADPQLGEGLARLEKINPELRDDKIVKKLIDTDQLHKLDRHARRLSDDSLANLAKDVVGGASGAKRRLTKAATLTTAQPRKEINKTALTPGTAAEKARKAPRKKVVAAKAGRRRAPKEDKG